MSKRPHLALVGGFLGAGKTTLILAAARLLAERGLRSALILNDQSDLLVDTELARSHGFFAGEVTGGCFCCRFSALLGAAQALRSHAPDVIFAEPVGSCTDLSATILQPLHEDYADAFRLAPLTVLVDPGRTREQQDSDVAFLFRKQLEEADVVCFTKADHYPGAPWLPGARQISAHTGQGVRAWLDEILRLSPGGKLLEIDYERYAQAEAALAWLNVECRIAADPPLSPAMLLGPLLDELDRELTSAAIPILHLKVLDHAASGSVKAALTANGQEPAVEGALSASPAAEHRLLVNLRASGDPDAVRAIAERALTGVPGEVSIVALRCFRPAAPLPERRVTRVIR